MSAVILTAVTLARLVPATWAAAAWVLAAALLLPLIDPWLAPAKGLALCQAVLWLLPRLGAGRTGLGVAEVRPGLA
jgi:hypothetical protein